MYKILLSKKSERQLNKISKNDQKKIARSIGELASFSEKTKLRNVKKLKTPFPGFRKRNGNYRILFEVIEENKKIIIYKIGHRKDIYRF